jgi:hypothetical protein
MRTFDPFATVANDSFTVANDEQKGNPRSFYLAFPNGPPIVISPTSYSLMLPVVF